MFMAPAPTETVLCGRMYFVLTGGFGIERRFCQRTCYHPGECGPLRQTLPPPTFHFAA